MNIHAFLEALPAAATQPLAFVAYVLTLVVWGALTHRSARLKTLLGSIKDLPESERAGAIRAEMGEATPPASIGVQDWLESKRARYRVLIVLALILSLTVVSSLAIVRVWREKGSIDATVGPAQDTRVGDGLDEGDGRASARLVSEVDGAEGYYSALREGGEIGQLRSVTPRLKDSSILIANNTERVLVVTEVRIRVVRSTIDGTPIPDLDGGVQALYLGNLGWGPMTDVELAYAFDPDAFSERQRGSAEGVMRDELARALPASMTSARHRTLERVTTSARIDIDNGYFEPFRGAGYFGDVPLRVRIRYQNHADAQVTGEDVVWVEQEPSVGAYLPPTAYYPVFLEAGRSGYDVACPVSQVVAAGESDHFRVQFRSDKSADFEVELRVIASDGSVIAADSLAFAMVVPRGANEDAEPAGGNRWIPLVTAFHALLAVGAIDEARAMTAGSARALFDSEELDALRRHPVVSERNTFWEGADRRLAAYVSEEDRRSGALHYEFDEDARIVNIGVQRR